MTRLAVTHLEVYINSEEIGTKLEKTTHRPIISFSRLNRPLF
jgi:hypothetical protein